MDRIAREWIAAGGGPAPDGAAVAVFSGLLGASRILSACERSASPDATPALHGVLAGMRALVRDLEPLPDRIDARARAAAGSAEPASRSAADREGTEDLLAAFDACFAALDMAHGAVDGLRDELVADLWIGAGLVSSALEALAICVRASLAELADEAYTRPTKARLIAGLHEARRGRERVLQAVESRLVL
jgi:hypothetical protein